MNGSSDCYQTKSNREVIFFLNFNLKYLFFAPPKAYSPINQISKINAVQI